MTPPADRLPAATGWRRLTGGSICTVWTADLGERAVVVKETPYDPVVEADGLQALRDAGAPVPEVIEVRPGLLVLERVSATADWAGLGHQLAQLHRHTAERFGWHRDNLIGSLPQANAWHEQWPAFYAEQRIRPFLDAPALPTPVRDRLERAVDGPMPALLDTDPAPSLIHGDLWHGNVVDGWWLIDPAVCHADREHELAFMDCFGGFPDALMRAYADAWPLPAGWERRRPALQLYHLLVHVRLFGSGYVPAVVSRLDALGW